MTRKKILPAKIRRNDPVKTVLRFNTCINNQDLQGLSILMAENHAFIDSDNNVQRGKELMVNVWNAFFKQYPDYQNHFSEVKVKKNRIIVTGHSTCSFKPLEGPAIWTAIVNDGFIEEWRVYDDTMENRIELKIKI